MMAMIPRIVMASSTLRARNLQLEGQTRNVLRPDTCHLRPDFYTATVTDVSVRVTGR
jgi:hypothetical protein